MLVTDEGKGAIYIPSDYILKQMIRHFIFVATVDANRAWTYKDSDG